MADKERELSEMELENKKVAEKEGVDYSEDEIDSADTGIANVEPIGVGETIVPLARLQSIEDDSTDLRVDSNPNILVDNDVREVEPALKPIVPVIPSAAKPAPAEATVKAETPKPASTSSPAAAKKKSAMSSTTKSTKSSKPEIEPREKLKQKRLRMFEEIVDSMQDPESGVEVKDRKLFLTTVPSCYLTKEMLDWMMSRLDFFDREEALRFSQRLFEAGYLFPLEYSPLKDDEQFCRFQTPYFWPSQKWDPTDFDYAVYLTKRTMRDKKKHELEKYEEEARARLEKKLANKWEFVLQQAEEQVRLTKQRIFKLTKQRQSMEKRIFDSQERAFWWGYRPPPDSAERMEVDPKKAFRNKSSPGYMSTPRAERKLNQEQLVVYYENKIRDMRNAMGLSRIKASSAAESIINRCDIYMPFDPFLSVVEPSNPWITDDITAWEIARKGSDKVTAKTARKWGISLTELLQDPQGHKEFLEFLEKEYSSENLKFWDACEALKKVPSSGLVQAVNEIYNHYMSAEATNEVNVDANIREAVVRKLAKPNYNIFHEAQKAIFKLMSKDSYPRFLNSKSYLDLLKEEL
eukprot:Colp12_sorted_trinity150504_noHs@13679